MNNIIPDNSRRNLLKEQCNVNIISNGNILNNYEKSKVFANKYFNFYYFFDFR